MMKPLLRPDYAFITKAATRAVQFWLAEFAGQFVTLLARFFVGHPLHPTPSYFVPIRCIRYPASPAISSR